LLHLLAVLSPSGEVVVGIDDTIERRWGGKIKARGIYRDAVRLLLIACRIRPSPSGRAH
jgi:hypothetical protein